MRTPNRTTQPEEGIALRKWREGIGIKQSELAKRAGLSQNLVSLLEAGKRNFTKDASDKIYRAMKELNAQRAEQLTSIALNRDSRQVAREELHRTSKKDLVKKVLIQDKEIDSLRSQLQGSQQFMQQQIGPLIAEAQEAWTERNLKPVTEELSEVRRELADMHRLLALKADSVGKEAQAQELQEQIEQRVRKGK